MQACVSQIAFITYNRVGMVDLLRTRVTLLVYNRRTGTTLRGSFQISWCLRLFATNDYVARGQTETASTPRENLATSLRVLCLSSNIFVVHPKKGNKSPTESNSQSSGSTSTLEN